MKNTTEDHYFRELATSKTNSRGGKWVSYYLVDQFALFLILLRVRGALLCGGTLPVTVNNAEWMGIIRSRAEISNFTTLLVTMLYLWDFFDRGAL